MTCSSNNILLGEIKRLIQYMVMSRGENRRLLYITARGKIKLLPDFLQESALKELNSN